MSIPENRVQVSELVDKGHQQQQHFGIVVDGLATGALRSTGDATSSP